MPPLMLAPKAALSLSPPFELLPVQAARRATQSREVKEIAIAIGKVASLLDEQVPTNRPEIC